MTAAGERSADVAVHVPSILALTSVSAPVGGSPGYPQPAHDVMRFAVNLSAARQTLAPIDAPVRNRVLRDRGRHG